MEATSSFIHSWAAAFQQGGITFALIGVALAIAIGITIERWLRLTFQYDLRGEAFMAEIQNSILNNDLEGAIRLCNSSKSALLPRVIKAGLQRASRSEDQIQNAIDAASLEVVPKVERRLPYLALIANVATLLGLLGTITGLIKSFQAVATSDPGQRQAILSAGISEAMNATAFGLVTAIFTMVVHAILSAKAQKILEEVDEFGVKTIDLLSMRKLKHGVEKL